jgi:ribosome-associated toxin RatA of RatAB toxin-antitoxin module
MTSVIEKGLVPMAYLTRIVAASALALSVLALSAVAVADTSSDATRLRDSRTAERYNTQLGQAPIRAGGAQIFVNAPLAQVRKVVTDYAHYQDFIPGFTRSRVVQRTKDHTDVYLQVPILHGAATVWAVSRFTKPTKLANGTEVIESTMQQGNVNDFRANYRLIPVDANHTILKAEILIVPKLPLPASVVTPELEYAADKAVTACRNKTEASADRVADRTTTP